MRHGGGHHAKTDRDAEEQIEEHIDVDAVPARQRDAEPERNSRVGQDQSRFRVGTPGEKRDDREQQAVLLELLQALRPGDVDAVRPRQQQEREYAPAVGEIEAGTRDADGDDRQTDEARQGAQAARHQEKQPDAQRRRDDVVLDEAGDDHEQDRPRPLGQRRRCVDASASKQSMFPASAESPSMRVGQLRCSTNRPGSFGYVRAAMTA